MRSKSVRMTSRKVGGGGGEMHSQSRWVQGVLQHTLIL